MCVHPPHSPAVYRDIPHLPELLNRHRIPVQKGRIERYNYKDRGRVGEGERGRVEEWERGRERDMEEMTTCVSCPEGKTLQGSECMTHHQSP